MLVFKSIIETWFFPTGLLYSIPVSWNTYVHNVGYVAHMLIHHMLIWVDGSWPGNRISDSTRGFLGLRMHKNKRNYASWPQPLQNNKWPVFHLVVLVYRCANNLTSVTSAGLRYFPHINHLGRLEYYPHKYQKIYHNWLCINLGIHLIPHPVASQNRWLVKPLGGFTVSRMSCVCGRDVAVAMRDCHKHVPFVNIASLRSRSTKLRHWKHKSDYYGVIFAAVGVKWKTPGARFRSVNRALEMLWECRYG